MYRVRMFRVTKSYRLENTINNWLERMSEVPSFKFVSVSYFENSDTSASALVTYYMEKETED